MLSAIRQRLEDRANQHVGLLAEFPDPGALVHAVEDLREKGYSQIDTFSPFPIHGMDRAMGLPVSKLGFMVFGGAVTGGFLGFLLQWWTSEVDYAINISNKPLFAWESSIPIMFELTILFAALTAVGGMLALNGLPKPYNPLFNSDRFSRATDDAFFVHVSVRDGVFSRATTADDLHGLGAMAVEYVDHDGAALVGAGGEPAGALVPVEEDRLPEPVTPHHTTGDI